MACLPRTPDAHRHPHDDPLAYPRCSAETHRLVALAAASLEDAGITDVASHIVLLQSDKSEEPVAFGGMGEFTVQSGRSLFQNPFSAEEVRRLATDSEAAGGTLIAAPGVPPGNEVLQKLLVPRRARPPLPRARSISSRRPISSRLLSAGAARRPRRSSSCWPGRSRSTMCAS